jgi:hypothetical protein
MALKINIKDQKEATKMNKDEVLLAQTQPIEGGSQLAPPQLNVIFQGLFAFVVAEDSIEVLVPEMSDHVYKAGTPNLSSSEPCGPLLDLSRGTPYELQGVTGRSKGPLFDPTVNAVISGAQAGETLAKVEATNPDPKLLFCSIRLPLPDEIHSLRRVPASKCPKGFFQGKDSALIKATELSLTQVLVYRNFKGSPLRLYPLEWAPQPNSNPVNLHVYAEAQRHMDAEEGKKHSAEGFKTLIKLLPGTQLELSCPDPKASLGRAESLPRIQERDLRDLAELCPSGKPEPFKRVVNCMSIVVQNPSARSHRAF